MYQGTFPRVIKIRLAVRYTKLDDESICLAHSRVPTSWATCVPTSRSFYHLLILFRIQFTALSHQRQK